MAPRIPVFVAVLLTVCSPSLFADGEPPPAAQQPMKVEARLSVTLNFLLHLPQGYDQRDAWPLLLFLHGAGERGDDLELVKVHGPPKLIAAGKDFPFIVVSPQCPEFRSWHALELTALLDHLEQRYKVDEDRIYVTGLSMGGSGTWMLALNYPDRFAAIAPICGRGDPRGAERIAHLPTWVFHGAKDEGVPLEYSTEMVEALKKAGGNPELTVYPDAGHDAWTETYENPGLYEWLLKQKRSPRSED